MSCLGLCTDQILGEMASGAKPLEAAKPARRLRASFDVDRPTVDGPRSGLVEPRVDDLLRLLERFGNDGVVAHQADDGLRCEVGAPWEGVGSL